MNKYFLVVSMVLLNTILVSLVFTLYIRQAKNYEDKKYSQIDNYGIEYEDKAQSSIKAVETVEDVVISENSSVEGGSAGKVVGKGVFLVADQKNAPVTNNPRPTISGRIENGAYTFLKSKFVREKAPENGEEYYYIRFYPSKLTNATITINNEPIKNAYGFATVPTIRCTSTDPNTNEEIGEKTYKDCIEENFKNIPDMVFYLKPEKQLTNNNYVLTISEDKVFLKEEFIVDTKYKVEKDLTFIKENLKKNNGSGYELLDANESCARGYYYDQKVLHVPLMKHNDNELLYGVSFPQSEEEKSSIQRRKLVIKFDNATFDLFFPSSFAYWKQDTTQDIFHPSQISVYIPTDNLYYTDGKKAEIWQWMNKGINSEYLELYPQDLSGKEYRGYSIPFQTEAWSGCDG